jgi:hypothetical protein
MGFPIFYNAVTSITNSAYNDTVKSSFGFTSETIVVHYRSGSNPISFSFNGAEDHGVIGGSAGFIQTIVLQPFQAHEIWLKGGTGDEIVEIIVTPIQ